ncbi:TIGR03619 family F420-dependent LLM class oxidoreductase [Pseudonocardia pini]|uniref:TIGR03619 family F420-dependent LLM class oxidoreductase n=1 Tax=Pseudonocardia pini TaxID=2758030 RepID=UPI0015F027BB|nr:TIGR03619 family F420-dependent LLM class oxidoreductase [Pseudonocardia pini]
MELGVGLPTHDGPLASPEAIARIAQEAEQLDYATLWTFERLLRPYAEIPGFGRVPEYYRTAYDPLETLSYVAALTSEIALGTSVMNALMHPPVVLARRFATLDRFSGGRVVAGLGQGWMPQEFETVNVPMSRQGAGMDEAVAAMRACWGPDPVAFEGRFHTIAPSEVNPKPVQAHIPVLMGSNTPGGIARAARIADGLNPLAFTYESLVGLTEAFHAAARAEGRHPGTLVVAARANVPITLDPIGTDRPFLGGSPRQIADDLARLEGTGVDQVLFSNAAAGDLDDEVKLLEQLRIEASR